MNAARRWKVEFVNEVALAEFMNLSEDKKAYFARICDLIDKYGLENLGRPHIAPLQKKLWEMRLKGKDGIARAIYIAQPDKRATILRVFDKKTREVPDKEIQLALKRLSEA